MSCICAVGTLTRSDGGAELVRVAPTDGSDSVQAGGADDGGSLPHGGDGSCGRGGGMRQALRKPLTFSF